MNVYEWLEQVKKLDELISTQLAERDHLLDVALKITQDISDMPRGSNVSDKVGTSAVKLAALAEETDRLVDLYILKKNEVVNTLKMLPPNQYGALHRHYIQYMTWEQVAEDMGKSTMQIYRYRKKGIKKLGVLLNVSSSGDKMIL